MRAFSGSPDDRGVREVRRLRDSLSPGEPYVHHLPDGSAVHYRVLGELETSGRHYAILQSFDDHPDEAGLFRIEQGVPMEIDDDNEWETVAEVVDEMLYFYDS
ncbi:DUF1292 domain-containing protein [Staphylospora marina]|uniref:DUF1292 domain-containing protein n=1 Tax=Staphylospora marina TaxID=2490858 RepID=UPI000F5C03EE|nr:DUF1292 domain-containing protein [Staphylospora marina]